jgi:hypothetical protein
VRRGLPAGIDPEAFVTRCPIRVGTAHRLGLRPPPPLGILTLRRDIPAEELAELERRWERLVTGVQARSTILLSPSAEMRVTRRAPAASRRRPGRAHRQ